MNFHLHKLRYDHFYNHARIGNSVIQFTVCRQFFPLYVGFTMMSHSTCSIYVFSGVRFDTAIGLIVANFPFNLGNKRILQYANEIIARINLLSYP